MEWYERWFGEEYLLVYEHRDTVEAEREVDTICKVLGLRSGELVLDLCCGSGRHDIPLARLGCRVVGLDYSPELLRIAHASKPVGSRYPLYVRADARDEVFGTGVFDAVLNLFTSFGYFSDDENTGLIRSIGRMLKDGGRFYIDYLNPPRVLESLVPESTKERNGVHVTERRRYVRETKRVKKTITIVRDGRAEDFHESVRLYNCAEITEMLTGARLRIDGVLGSIEGVVYSETSPRMILFGTKLSAQTP